MAKETIPASPGKAAATVTDDTPDAWAKWGAEVDKRLDAVEKSAKDFAQFMGEQNAQLSDRIGGIDQKMPTLLGSIGTRLEALEKVATDTTGEDKLLKRLDAVEARVKDIAGLPKSKDSGKVDTGDAARLARVEQMLGLTSHVDAKDSEGSDPASDPVEDGKAGE